MVWNEGVVWRDASIAIASCGLKRRYVGRPHGEVSSVSSTDESN